MPENSPVTILPGSSFFGSDQAFAMIRGGHMNMSILGAMQVSCRGDLANWRLFLEKLVKGMGGAMDLVASTAHVIVAMEHNAKDGAFKIVEECSLPLTGRGVVNDIVTELGWFHVSGEGLEMKGIAEGVTKEEVTQRTGCQVHFSQQLSPMLPFWRRFKMSVFTALIDGLSFTECPRWRDGRLYFSDRYTRRILAVSIDGSVETYARTDGLPAGIGFLPDGGLLITSMRDRKVLRREHDGSIVEHADLSALAAGHLNDMLVDHEGRAWVGNFGFDLFKGEPARSTILICRSLPPDGAPGNRRARGLAFPNGTVLTPDGRTLIIAETLANRLSAFTVSAGALSERRTWAAFGDPPATADVGKILKEAAVAPDGICLDAEGAVWVADVLNRRVIRVTEGGKIVQELKTNGLCAFACMLGGDDGQTLFVCAAPTFDETEAAAHHRSSILMTKVEVPHAGLP